MNCFEWQSRASDYLDGTLIGSPKRDADEHLDECASCTQRYKRFRVILESIAAQPRSTLPIPIRKSPFTASIARVEGSVARDLVRIGKSRWQRLPWYLRTSAEGLGIVLLILAGISAAPKIRALYERGIERSMSEFADALTSESQPPTTSAPLVRGNAKAALETVSEDEEEAEDYDSESEGEKPGAAAGKSEIWRFNLKTDSPHEVRTKIIELLGALGIPRNAPGLGGIEAPGGIQFDLLMPQAAVPKLKSQLQKMAPAPPTALADTPGGETFTWFKNRSKRAIPEGKTRVVIWLSQI